MYLSLSYNFVNYLDNKLTNKVLPNLQSESLSLGLNIIQIYHDKNLKRHYNTRYLQFNSVQKFHKIYLPTNQVSIYY